MASRPSHSLSGLLLAASFLAYTACFAVYVGAVIRVKGFGFQSKDIWDIPLTVALPLLGALLVAVPVWFWRRQLFMAVFRWTLLALSFSLAVVCLSAAWFTVRSVS